VVVPALYIAEQHPALFWGAVLGAMAFLAWGIHRIGWLHKEDGDNEDDTVGMAFVIVLIGTACLWWVWAGVALLVSLFLDTDIWPF
jgi:hypothetical protein